MLYNPKTFQRTSSCTLIVPTQSMELWIMKNSILDTEEKHRVQIVRNSNLWVIFWMLVERVAIEICWHKALTTGGLKEKGKHLKITGSVIWTIWILKNDVTEMFWASNVGQPAYLRCQAPIVGTVSRLDIIESVQIRDVSNKEFKCYSYGYLC